MIKRIQTMRFHLLFIGLMGFSLGAPGFLLAESDPKPEAAAAPGVDLVTGASASMTQDQLEAYFQNQKKGAPVQLMLDKGKEVKGLFSSYDEYYETVWIVPRKEDRGLLNQKGYKLAGIRGVTLWDPASAASTETDSGNDGFILMKKDADSQ